MSTAKSDRENTIFHAGQVIGLAMRLKAEAYRDAAKTSDLNLEYRQALELLAKFREELFTKAGHP